MPTKNDPAILFPIVIGLEVLILISIGANAAGHLSSQILLLFCFTQIVVLSIWGSWIYKRLKSMFYKIFWTTIFVGLLFFNLVLAVKFIPHLIDYIHNF